jgi:hypothetical protein
VPIDNHSHYFAYTATLLLHFVDLRPIGLLFADTNQKTPHGGERQAVLYKKRRDG